MKLMGITQRVTFVKSYKEQRDCLDQRWAEFALRMGYLPIALPNTPPECVEGLLERLSVDVVVFTGGNNLVELDPLAEDVYESRDSFEFELLHQALNRSIPILGVCRGMQLINVALGGQLERIPNHVATRHSIVSIGATCQLPNAVNSYHSWGIKKSGLADNLEILAVDEDDNIEAFKHIQNRLLGLMWHPEREKPFNELDFQLIKGILE